MADRLTVWLYGAPVAVLEREANLRLSLSWLPEGQRRWGTGSRVLSVSLPLGARISPKDNRPLDFFENLLPEGPAKQAMAHMAGVPAADTFGLLAQFGGDCAGAVVILPEGQDLPPAGAGRYVPLSGQELMDAVRDLPVAPFGARPEVGFKPSLPGFQGKLLVGRQADGTFSRPENGAPSTWILKPDGRVPMAANETACLRLALAAGLDVPQTELLDIGGTPTVAVKRYDRRPSGERLHQEDALQATGSPAGWKYEMEGGPSLRALAKIVRDFGPADGLEDLLARVTFNVCIGNADAHAKNFSLLHPDDGFTVKLAPVYDLVATVALEPTNEAGERVVNDTRMGQKVDGVLDIEVVSRENLVNEGTSWGLRRAVASQTVDAMFEAVAEASRAAEPWLAELARRRLGQLGARPGRANRADDKDHDDDDLLARAAKQLPLSPRAVLPRKRDKTCGFWMPKAQKRCILAPRHHGHHRSQP